MHMHTPHTRTYTHMHTNTCTRTHMHIRTTCTPHNTHSHTTHTHTEPTHNKSSHSIRTAPTYYTRTCAHTQESDSKHDLHAGIGTGCFTRVVPRTGLAEVGYTVHRGGLPCYHGTATIPGVDEIGREGGDQATESDSLTGQCFTGDQRR